MPTTDFKAHTDLIYSLGLSPDGKLLATAGFDGSVKLWDLAGRKELRTLAGHSGPVYGVSFSADGLASAGFDRTLRLWDPAAGKELHKVGLPDDPYAVAVAPDGKRVAVAGYAGHLSVWEWGRDKPVFEVKRPSPAYSVV